MSRTINIKNLERHITPEMVNEHFNSFSKVARYVGNGVYTVTSMGLYSTDTGELLRMYIAVKEKLNIKFR